METPEQVAAREAAEVEVVEKVPEAERTPAQKRIIQLVSQRKAVEAERDTFRAQATDAQAQLAARAAAEQKAIDDAALANAKTAEDFKKIQDKIEADAAAKVAEYEDRMNAQQTAMLERAGKMVLSTLAAQNGMTNPDYIRLFDCEIEIDPETLEVTPEGLKVLTEEFDKFKKANPTLFGNAVAPKLKPHDGGPSRVLTAAEKFDKGLAKEMSPIELIAAGLSQKASGR